MIFTKKKNIERKPIIANTFEKNTIYGSLVILKMAGIESTAKITSVKAITTMTTNKGVIYSLLALYLCLKKNLSETNFSYTLKNL